MRYPLNISLVFSYSLGSVAGSVIQTTGRTDFEDGLWIGNQSEVGNSLHVNFGGGDHTDCRIFIWKLTLTSTYLDSHEYEENPVINSNYFMYTDCRIGCGLTLLKLWPLFGGRATQGGLNSQSTRP